MENILYFNMSIFFKYIAKCMLTKTLKKTLTVLMQMLHHFLTIDINITGEPVPDPRAYISWLFHIANTLA